MRNFKLFRKRGLLIFLTFLIAFTMIAPTLVHSFAASSSDTAIRLKAEVSKDSITLSWNSITHKKGVNGYYVFRATKSGGQTSTPETDFWIKGTTYTDKKIEPGKTYYYIVRPVLGDGSLGNPSNEVSVYYQKDYKPITLKATVNAGSITLQWNKLSDVQGYYVYRATKSGGQTKTPETDFWIKGTTYTDIKVVPGTTYYYIVRPVLSDGKLGEPSNEVKVKYQEIYGNISLTIGNSVMLVNGKLMEIDPGKRTAPVLKDARTMLPIRAVIEAMGGTVDYTSGEMKVTIKYKGKTIYMWIGSKTIQVDGVKKTIDVAPYFSETGRTMIPIRFVVENLDCEVKWDGNTQTVYISYLLDNDNNYPKTPPKQVPDENSWTGTWYTNRGVLKLVQTGYFVTGTYGDDYNLQGVVYIDDGKNKLVGTYDEDGTTGDLEFVLSKDGDEFDGKYAVKNKQKKTWLDWDGTREKDPLLKYLRELSKPAVFTGTWDINFGDLLIFQKDAEVYAVNKEIGLIKGKVANNRFTGTYRNQKDSGSIEIYMLEGNKNIIGHYGNNDDPKQDWKQFKGTLKSSKVSENLLRWNNWSDWNNLKNKMNWDDWFDFDDWDDGWNDWFVMADWNNWFWGKDNKGKK